MPKLPLRSMARNMDIPPAQVAAFIRAEIVKWARVVPAAGVTAE